MSNTSMNLFSQNKFKAAFPTRDFLDADIEANIVNFLIPDISLGEISIPQSYKDIFYPGDSLLIQDVQITCILDETWKEWRLFYTWLYAIKSCKETEIRDYMKNGIVSVLDNKSNHLFEIRLDRCFPVNIGMVELNTQTDAVDYSIFTVILKCNDITINDDNL